MDEWRISEQAHSKRLSDLVTAFFAARRNYLRVKLDTDPPADIQLRLKIAQQWVDVAELAMLEFDLTSKGVE